MADIEKIEVFKYRGEIFPTVEKAVEHAEGLVHDLLKRKLLQTEQNPKGFTSSEVFRITEVIVHNRKAFLDLLSYGYDPEAND